MYTAKSAFRSHLYRNHPNLKGVPIDQFRDDGLVRSLPDSDPSTLSSEIVIKPETLAPDESMSETTTSVDSEATTSADQDSLIEGNPNGAAEEPIASSSDGVTTSLQALIAENTRPTDAGGHFCIICDKDLGYVKRHFEDLHWSDAPSYFCPAPKCQKVYTAKSAFSMHLRRNHPDWKGVPLDTFLQTNEEPVEQNLGENPMTLEALIAKNARPTGAGGHFCIICAKVLGKGYAKRHFEDLHWSDAPSYHCPAPECQKVYTAKSAMSMHIRRNHPELKGVSLETLRKVD